MINDVQILGLNVLNALAEGGGMIIWVFFHNPNVQNKEDFCKLVKFERDFS